VTEDSDIVECRNNEQEVGLAFLITPFPKVVSDLQSHLHIAVADLKLSFLSCS